MVKLCCTVVGDERVVIIDIGTQQLVGDLKKVIKRDAGFDFPSDRLTLYLAKQDGSANGTWMTTSHKDYAPLSRGNDGVEAIYLTPVMLLDPTWGYTIILIATRHERE